MQFFKIDGPLYRVLDKLTNLLILNLIFLLCCLPIVTIGPALTAMYYVNIKVLRDEEPSSVIKCFFRSFKENFKQGLWLGLGVLVIAALLIFDLHALTSVVNIPAPIAQVLIFISVFLLIALLLVSLYLFAILAQFDNTSRELIKWSAILAIRHLPVTLISAVLVALPLGIFMVLPDFFLRVMVPVMVLIGFSGTSYLQSLFYVQIFDFYIPKAETDEEPDEGTELDAE